MIYDDRNTMPSYFSVQHFKLTQQNVLQVFGNKPKNWKFDLMTRLQEKLPIQVIQIAYIPGGFRDFLDSCVKWTIRSIWLHVCQFWRNPLKGFQIYCFHENETWKMGQEVTSTFDRKKWITSLFESKWVCVPILKEFPQGFLEISPTQKQDVRTCVWMDNPRTEGLRPQPSPARRHKNVSFLTTLEEKSWDHQSYYHSIPRDGDYLRKKKWNPTNRFL